ncbi:PREDICTED: uncharacterized protein LOC109166840 [Ipomoea nil]|uniref:uncharacterized protein LOC109166840 n=1 Tax=Ipomoea nil TaxID=35883 RepID=UPI00090166D2|nr:PREDICTED: uncharacterized protein LOC109166840 [Ipomoea nil]
MLKYYAALLSLSSPPPSLPIFPTGFTLHYPSSLSFSSSSINGLKPAARRLSGSLLHSRRRVIYDDDNEDEEEDGYNAEIAMLEVYSQSVKDEALLVKAVVDEEEVEVIIFKGFSSSLSYGTSPDPTKSVLPAKAKIKYIDRIKGPFNPSNIDYIERDIPWDAFKSLL